MSQEEVVIRPLKGTELGYVVKNWVRSYANSPWSGAMSRERQVEAIRGTILDLIKRGAVVQVATPRGRPDKLFGFVCYERGFPWPVVHYVFVTDRYRESGIGSRLVEAAKEGSEAHVRYSHKTILGQYLFKQGKHYRPKLSRRPKRRDVVADPGPTAER